MKQIFFKKASAWLLAVCMVITMLPLNSALAATPPANGMVISSADVYAKYGGSATVHFLFEMDANGSKNYTATAGGLFQLSSSNPALLPSLRTSNFSCMNPITKSPWNIMYSESNGQMFPTALDLTSTAFDVSMRMDNVTSDPNLGIEPVERYGGAMIDVLQNGKAIQLAMSDVSIIDMPHIKFVYDMTVEPQANGQISYPARTFSEATSAMSAPANKTVASGATETTQAAVGDSTIFTLAPSTGYVVDHMEITTPSGTQSVATSQMTAGANNTMTYTLAGLSSVSSASDKVTVKGFFKASTGGVTYLANGGTITPPVTDTTAYTMGQTITVKYPSGTATGASGTPVFAGWKDSAGNSHHPAYTSKDGATTIPALGGTATMVAGGVTFTAIWSTDNNNNNIPDVWETSYKVSYSANGGTIASMPAEKEYAPNTTVSVWYPTTATPPSAHSDYIFAGWKDLGATTNNWYHEAFTGTNGTVPATASSFSMPARAVTLTAQWMADSNPKDNIPDELEYTFTYDTTSNPNAASTNTNSTELVLDADGTGAGGYPNNVPTPAAKSDAYKFSGWTSTAYTGVRGTSDIKTTKFASNTTFIAGFEDNQLSKDPIRPYDPNDKTNKDPTNAPDWLIPSENEHDDSGSQDDKIVAPTNPGTGGDKLNGDGSLVLPSGGTITDANGGNQQTLPNDTIVDRDGTIWWPIHISLVENSNPSNPTTITPPEGFDTIQYAKDGYGATVMAPSIKGYILDATKPNYMTFDATTVKTAGTVTFFYIKYDGDPVRPYDPAAPTNKNPATHDQWLVPSTNGKDESAQGAGNDDILVTPTKDSAGKDNSSVNDNGNLLLPDGATLKKPDGSSETIPDAMITPNGQIYYAIHVLLMNTTTTPATAITAPAGYETTYYVLSTQTTDYTIAAPAITDLLISGSNSQSVKVADVKDGKNTVTFNYIRKGDKVVLSFDMDGGTSLSAMQVELGTKVDLSKYSSLDATEAAYKVSKEGYRFLGFFSTKAAATAAGSANNANATGRLNDITVNANTTVYAAWGSLMTSDHIAYLQGYPGGTFQPTKSMTRAEVAQMFYNLWSDKSGIADASFSDVPSNAWYATPVKVLSAYGLLKGYTDGTFKPNKSISRAEFATIASRFDKLSAGTKTFNDVPSTFWAYQYISSAATKGWVNGYEDGTFKPNNPITRAEVVQVTNNVRGQKADETYIKANIASLKTFSDVQSSYWAYYQIIEATNGHDYTQLKDSDGKVTSETWTALKK